VLKEAEAGAKTKDLCRKHGISDASFYNWKAKYNHAKTDIDRVAHARKGEGLQGVKSFVRDLTMLWSRLPTGSMNSSWRIFPG
jgi:transposase-like protein